MEYKETLQMLETEFEMRGNLAQKEPGILKEWEDDDHYHKILEANKDKKPFILHDGPPYANGNLHAGTAMNRIIKDIIVRSHAMEGYYTPFFPGWDTHGLPIENAIQKLGVNRKEVSPEDFRKKCEEYARGQIATQMATEKRLGQVADYEHPYITLNKEFEARQVRSFAKMALDGMIFQGLKPIYWSPWQETAIADSEIVYFDKKDTSIFVAFDVLDPNGVLDGDEKFVIWTTTPWTIPSNLAVCLNEAFTYAVVNTEKGKLIFLESKIDELLPKFGLTNLGVVKTFKGRELEYVKVKHPFYPERPSTVILGNHVSDEDGTGCVHTAPGLGTDDFLVGAKYGIPAFSPVDDKGCLTEEVGEDLAGKFVVGEEDDSANVAVIKKLAACDALLAKEKITHSYPHDDRLKKPVIFRSTVQWFASIDKVKPQLLDAIKKVKWCNSFGEVRLTNMIAARKDWCISRQRLWGVPIPIIYNEDKSPIIEKEVFDHIADLFEEFGSNVWFERDAKDLLPEGYINPKSPNGNYTKEKDIMDVWFDSGSSWNELGARGYDYPCDLYFEGSDQYRGWFNSSLIVSVACNNTAPYKSVLSHGYVCDSKGEAMHKSVGNVVNPLDIISKYGADILRLWAATSDFKQDMRIGDSNMKQVAEQYRKVRNTLRFMLGYTNKKDFDYKNDLVDFDNLEPLDKYMMVRLNDVTSKVRAQYLDYNYVSVTSILTNFMINDLSSYYFDFAKDILMCDGKTDSRRRKVQTVLYNCLDAMLKLWAPILPYTTYEAWKVFGTGETNSVHYTNFPEVKEYEEAEELLKKFEKIHSLREEIFKAREEAIANKVIDKPLEAEVQLSVSEEEKQLLNEAFGEKVDQWLKVSKVSFVEGDRVVIKKAQGTVCPRCWNITITHREDCLCDRCTKVLGL